MLKAAMLSAALAAPLFVAGPGDDWTRAFAAHFGAGPAAQKHRGAVFSMLDANRDARVDRAEFGQAPDVFNIVDANRDGGLSREEIDLYAVFEAGTNR